MDVALYMYMNIFILINEKYVYIGKVNYKYKTYNLINDSMWHFEKTSILSIFKQVCLYVLSFSKCSLQT